MSDALSDKEIAVLRCMALGHTDAVVAHVIATFKSPKARRAGKPYRRHSVAAHFVPPILAKLGAMNRIHAVFIAAKRGLI